ncbi:MAG: hypothetical protein IH855_04815 [Bacteroidetes bacterium]|nr:hypothetical protein [Bacteroidota bacterium]
MKGVDHSLSNGRADGQTLGKILQVDEPDILGRDKAVLIETVHRVYRENGKLISEDFRRPTVDSEPPEIRGIRPVAFSADAEDVEKHLEDARTSGKPSPPCSALGLAHFSVGDGVLAIFYELNGVDLASPTAFDGGPNAFLCINDDGSGANRALCLPECTLGEVEFVHKPIELKLEATWEPFDVLDRNLDPGDNFEDAFPITWSEGNTDTLVEILTAPL